MKLKHIIYSTAFSALLFTAVSCEEVDTTGDSLLKPTNPTITVTGAAITASPTVSDDVNTDFSFTLTMSEAQVVDVAVWITKTAGTADLDADFSLSTGKVIIPAYKTSASFVLTTLSDCVIEDQETFTITIGDDRTANATIVPVTASFTINNAINPNLDLGLSWAAELFYADGTQIPATDIADLVFEIEAPDGTITSVDGAAFEGHVLEEGDADGVYIVRAGFYSAIDLGQLGDLPMLDLSLSYVQCGKIDESSVDFPASYDLTVQCEDNKYTIATIAKAGNTYTITPVGETALMTYVTPLVGNWTGVDVTIDAYTPDVVYDSEVATSISGGNFKITGLNTQFMEDFWGEEVLSMNEVVVNVDYCQSVFVIEIEEQDYMTTLYSGDEYDYTIVGSGTIDQSGASPVIHIQYKVLQDGFDVAEWLNDNGYHSSPWFEADIEL